MTETEREMRRQFAQELATLLDNNSDPDGMWTSGDLINVIATFIQENGGWSVCGVDHLVYSSAKSECPYCQWRNWPPLA